MHFVSIAVLLYQAVIFSIIIAASVISGRTACVIFTLLLCMWTLTHVFFPPLMVLQFIVIVISFTIGMSITSNKSKCELAMQNNEPNRREINTTIVYKHDSKSINTNIKRCYSDGKIVYELANRDAKINKLVYIIVCALLLMLAFASFK